VEEVFQATVQAMSMPRGKVLEARA